MEFVPGCRILLMRNTEGKYMSCVKKSIDVKRRYVRCPVTMEDFCDLPEGSNLQ